MKDAGNIDLPKSSHSTPTTATTFVLQEKFENFCLWGSKSVHFHEKLIDFRNFFETFRNFGGSLDNFGGYLEDFLRISNILKKPECFVHAHIQ